MINHLTGTLVEKQLTRAVIEVGGIGFNVLIPMSTYDRLPRVGESTTLLTQLNVREDALTLYGFASAQERQLFGLVTEVTGIGPKLGLSILSCMTVNRFCQAVINKDLKSLARIQGIGKRTAERLTVELAGKVEELAPAVALGAQPEEAPLSAAAEDAVAGLITLGYKSDQARKRIRDLIEASEDRQMDAQQLIRQALATLSK